MEQWFALYTVPGGEKEAAELLERAVTREFWSCCRIPRKLKVFRSGGTLHLLDDVMFPGYLFVKTTDSRRLLRELRKARKFPQLIGDTKGAIAPVEEKDLKFLQDVCGENLQKVMGVTKIVLNEQKQIIQADGILERYRDQIVKLDLHKRFAVVEIELFNRTQAVLFGVSLNQDQAG